MRVISGKARGRRLKEPLGRDIRPTTDKVKESIFNILQFDIEGRRVLDLFAGTGQLGIEALSRGAAGAVFVDASPKALALVRENLKIADVAENAEVYQAESVSFLSHTPRKFDLVFLDPPYDTPLLEQALNAVFQFDILKPNGIILCESRENQNIPSPVGPYSLYRTYRYGQISLAVITRSAEI